MAEDTGISSDDDIDLDLLDEEELEHRRELAAVISNMKTQLSNYAAEKREQDIKGLESLVRDVLDDVASGEEMKRHRTESLPHTRDQGEHEDGVGGSGSGSASGSRRVGGNDGGRPGTKNAVSNLLGETDAEDLTDHEHEEDVSVYENRSGLAEDMKFLASMPELCGQCSAMQACVSGTSCEIRCMMPPLLACVLLWTLVGCRAHASIGIRLGAAALPRSPSLTVSRAHTP